MALRSARATEPRAQTKRQVTCMASGARHPRHARPSSSTWPSRSSPTDPNSARTRWVPHPAHWPQIIANRPFTCGGDAPSPEWVPSPSAERPGSFSQQRGELGLEVGTGWQLVGAQKQTIGAYTSSACCAGSVELVTFFCGLPPHQPGDFWRARMEGLTMTDSSLHCGPGHSLALCASLPPLARVCHCF